MVVHRRERVARVVPNNAFERTVKHRGPRLAAARRSWSAAQIGSEACSVGVKMSGWGGSLKKKKKILVGIKAWLSTRLVLVESSISFDGGRGVVTNRRRP